MFLLVLPRLLGETFIDLFYFPIWWYTGGAYRSARWCFGLILNGNYHFAPGLWLRNLFVPMYGQYDFEGRLISFFMRLFQFFIRALVLFIWSVFCLCLFLIWLLLPILTVYGFLAIKF